jgi:hypothetical protein
MQAKNSMPARAKRVVGALCLTAGALLMTACGGGGDDGPDVSITQNGPTQVEQTVGSGHETEMFTIRAQVSGDVEALDGMTLYVRATDSGSMFQPSTEVFVDSYTLEATMNVSGQVATTEGDHTGVVSVDVCYDAACNSPMKGSPMRVPYTVHVLAGLSVDDLAPSYATPFGVDLASQQVAVRLPDNVKHWAILDRPEDGSWAHDIATATPMAGADSLHGWINIDFTLQQPGTYTAAYLVHSWSTSPSGVGEYEYEQEITITYTVQDNAAKDYWITPSDIAFSHAQGDNEYHGGARSFRYVGNTDVSIWVDGFEYLSEPAAAQSHILHNDWFDWGMRYERVCYQEGNDTPDCLPPGLYTGRYRVKYEKGGQTFYTYVPLSMTITP